MDPLKSWNLWDSNSKNSIFESSVGNIKIRFVEKLYLSHHWKCNIWGLCHCIIITKFMFDPCVTGKSPKASQSNLHSTGNVSVLPSAAFLSCKWCFRCLLHLSLKFPPPQLFQTPAKGTNLETERRKPMLKRWQEENKKIPSKEVRKTQ